MYTPEEAKALREQDPFDTRNIRDKFKGKDHEDIMDELAQTRTPLVIISENLIGDFNVSQIVRSANAFNAMSVYIAGNRRWNRKGAVGTHNYIEVRHFECARYAIEECRDMGYEIVAAELTDEAISLENYIWLPKTAIVVGEEGRGLSQAALDLVDNVVYIPMLGTVRSLNVAGATQIMAYHYTQQLGYFSES